MSLGEQPPLPPNVSAALLEQAYLRGNGSSARPAPPAGSAAAVALLGGDKGAKDEGAARDLRAWGETTVDAEALARLTALMARHDPEREPSCEAEDARHRAGERGALSCESDV